MEIADGVLGEVDLDFSCHRGRWCRMMIGIVPYITTDRNRINIKGVIVTEAVIVIKTTATIICAIYKSNSDSRKKIHKTKNYNKHQLQHQLNRGNRTDISIIIIIIITNTTTIASSSITIMTINPASSPSLSPTQQQ